MTADADYRRLLGAYIIGALDPDEEARVAAHVRSCCSCHTELLELGAVVADLALLTPDGRASSAEPDLSSSQHPSSQHPSSPDLSPSHPSPSPSPGLASVTSPASSSGAASAGGGAHRRAAGMPRRRLFTFAAAAAGLASATGVGFALGQGADGTAPDAAPPVAAGTRTVESRDSTTNITAQAVLTPAPWGTGIQLTVAGTQQTVAAGVHCTLFAVSRTGKTDTAGSWAVPARSPTPAGERIRASTAIPLQELSALRVATVDGQELLTVPV
jgi:anti-sigma factor RsiW